VKSMEKGTTFPDYPTNPSMLSPKDFPVTSIQLHGFSDASEEAYAGVVYLRLESSDGRVHTTLVVSKTKVAPIKRLSRLRVTFHIPARHL